MNGLSSLGVYLSNWKTLEKEIISEENPTEWSIPQYNIPLFHPLSHTKQKHMINILTSVTGMRQGFDPA